MSEHLPPGLDRPGRTTLAPPPPTALDLTAGLPGLRAQARTARLHRRRRHRLWWLLLVLALLAASVAVVLAGTGRSTRHPAVAVPASTQQTLLLGIGASGAGAQSVALLGLTPAGAGATLLIPPDTLVDGPGRTVGGSYAIAAAGEFPGSLSDLLGVRVDGTWRLSPTALAALVDGLGGVTVDVDEAIVTAGLSLAPGTQTLTGGQAAAYALYLGGETEQARANRTRLVLDGVLAKVGAGGRTSAQLGALLGGLGVGSTTAWTPTRLAAYLGSLAVSDVAQHEEALPVTALDAGSSTPTFALDGSAEPALVAGLFGPSLRHEAGAAGTRVEVVNDSGRPGLATSTRARLSAAGLTFVRATNDNPFHQYARSSILVFDASPGSIAFGRKVAAALGLPHAPVLVSSQTSSVVDALAVLATDYRG